MIVSLSGCQYVCAFADPTDSLTRPWHVYLMTCLSIYSLYSYLYPLISLQTCMYTYTSKQLCIPILSLCSSVDAYAQYSAVQNVCIVLLEYARSCLEVSQLLYDGMYIQDGALVVPQHLQ